MKYRIIENTYEDLSIKFVIEYLPHSNSAWKLQSSRTYEKQKDAEDWITATIEKEKGEFIVSSRLIGEYP